VNEFSRRRYENPDISMLRLLGRLERTPIISEYATEVVMRCSMQINLTTRRIQALELVAQGYKNKEIGEELGVSSTAATDYVKCAMAVLVARNRCHAVHLGHKIGLLTNMPPGKPRLVANHNKAREWSDRRLEALLLCAEGYSQKEIGLQMGSHQMAVRDYLRAAHHLLGATGAANAVHRAHLEGILD
jgi:DNA-binding NarL/FixJ family response regulator